MNPAVIAVLLLLLTGAAVKKTKKRFRTPVRGSVTSGYGFRIHPFSKKREKHNGVDIAIPSGTPIYSPAAGTAYSSKSRRGGRQLHIKHKGYTSGYSHLSRRLRTGTKVKKGTLIAYSGSSGQVTAAHLHFTWKKGNNYVDPERYFKF